ncbi:HAD-IA family hydrolase [Streptococcus massiliensis]|uniref:HAD superfamily hydrolase n=1 Tax=Streptococcus massiliensis TaxID=313439 RepID=A0A380L3B3_9STRE|nr:HAD-IA family hydrolase [Streptococcus massiliensis]SUN77020.1 HAD superfamily hydrolase [Streptococcus massiliensis]
MTTTFIWDLDGTLIDSYGTILNSLETAYAAFDLPFEREKIQPYILQTSVGQLFKDIKAEKGLDLQPIYAESLETRNHEIEILDGAEEILAWAQARGIEQFIYTHKGDNAFVLLEDLGLQGYFREILTADRGLKRKPHPEGVDYLVDKYQLKRETCYYIGDRPLDVDVAINSGIQSINFCDYKPAYNQKIEHLKDIKNLF